MANFGGSPYDVAAAFLGAASLLAAIGLMLWARRAVHLAREEERQVLKLAAALEDAESVLSTAPAGAIVLDPLGRDRSIGSAHSLLGRTGAVGLADLIGALHLSEVPRLKPLVDRLQGHGERFTVHLRLADRRVIQVDGRPVGARTVLWLTDVNRPAQEILRLSAALTEAETERDMLQDMLDSAPFAIWRRDHLKVLTSANQSYLATIEAPSLEAARLVDGLDSPQSPQPEPGRASRERRPVIVGGARRALDIIRVALQGGTAGYAQDVTDLAEAESVLRRHIEAHAETLDRLSVPVAIFGPDKRLEFYNRAFSQLWRLPEEWLAAKPQDGEVLEALRERRRLPEQADFRAWKRQRLALYTQTITPREELWHLPDGTTLKVTCHPHPFGGLLFVYEDVSERLRLESSYNTLIRVQRETLDHLYEGVAVFGSDGRLKLFNPAYGRIWHLDSEWLAHEPHVDDIADRCRDLFHIDSSWAEFRNRITGVVTSRLAAAGRIERPDGSVVDFESRPLPDGGVLLSYLDVSDTIRVERTLRERNEALESADRMKSEFISNVSLHLRAPLQRILELSATADSDARAISRIEESAAQLATLLDDILELASFDAGEILLERQEVEITHLFADAAVSIAARARDAGIETELQGGDGLGRAWLDPRRVRQMLVHLAAHLVRLAPRGAILRLGCDSVDEGLVFAVGLAMPALPPLAEPSEDELARRGLIERRRSSGVDLPLVQRLAALHDGLVEFGTEPEGGPRILCTLATGIKAPRAA